MTRYGAVYAGVPESSGEPREDSLFAMFAGHVWGSDDPVLLNSLRSGGHRREAIVRPAERAPETIRSVRP